MLNQIANVLMAGSSSDFADVFSPILGLIDDILPYIIGLIGSLGSLWCVVLGLKLAKAEEQQERDKAKNALKNAVIGFVLIFVLMATLKFAMPALQNWMAGVISGT